MRTIGRPGRQPFLTTARRRLALAAALLAAALLTTVAVGGPSVAQAADDTPPIWAPYPDENTAITVLGRVDGPFDGETAGVAPNVAWAGLIGPGCPSTHPNDAGLFAMTTPESQTRSSGTFLGYTFTWAPADVSFTIAEAGIDMQIGDTQLRAPTWDAPETPGQDPRPSLEQMPEFSEPDVYELLMFCSSATGPDINDENTVAGASGWLSFNAQTWTITAEEPAGEPAPTQFNTFTATVDGTEVEDGVSFPEGSDVEIVAEIAPAEATGTVEVHDGSEHSEDTLLGEATVADGTATITLENVEEGEYALTGAFVPADGAAFAGSQTVGAGIPLTIVAPDAVETSTSLVVTPESPVEAGAEVTLTATVEPRDAAGQVQFRVGGEPFGEPADLADGTAVLTTTELQEGELSLSAAFLPTDPDAFTASTSAPVTYTVGDAGPQVSAVDDEGNPLADNPTLEDGQVVTLTAPGFAAEEEVTVTLDPAGEAPEELGAVDADAEGTATTEFTAANLEPGQHALDFAGADQTLTWEFQLAGETGEDDGNDDGDDSGTDDGGDEDGGTDGGTDDGTAGAAGAAGGNANPSGSLAQTGAFIVGPAVLLGLAAVSAGYAFIRRSRRDELLTFDDTTAA